MPGRCGEREFCAVLRRSTRSCWRQPASVLGFEARCSKNLALFAGQPPVRQHEGDKRGDS